MSMEGRLLWATHLAPPARASLGTSRTGSLQRTSDMPSGQRASGVARALLCCLRMCRSEVVAFSAAPRALAPRSQTDSEAEAATQNQTTSQRIGIIGCIHKLEAVLQRRSRTTFALNFLRDESIPQAGDGTGILPRVL